MNIKDLLEQLTMKIAGVKIENTIPVFPYTIEEHMAIISALSQQQQREELIQTMVKALGKVNDTLLELIPKNVAIDNPQHMVIYNLYHSNNQLLARIINVTTTPQPQGSTIITEVAESKEEEK